MSVTIAKAILHLVLLLFFAIVLLWILFFFHGTGLNSLLIPGKLRWHRGASSQTIKLWYVLSCVISYLEWFGLLWLVNKFNYWYGQEWLRPSQMQVAKTATVVVGLITAICVAAYYITSAAAL
ncbi:MAG: hypothetical protein EOO61_17280 [Hymenobacter sp.]|nr:MAG: hypothetical protein EOO61_17280 [Hymenobacter sp.]